MHLLTLKEKNRHKLPADTYVADDVNCGESLARREATVAPACINTPPFAPAADWNGKRLLFCRGGGAGDILFVTPAIREIKKRWPDVHIAFACFEYYKAVLENNPDISEVLDFPTPLSRFTTYDGYVYLEEMHDTTQDAKTIHAVDLINDLLGLKMENKELSYTVTDEEKAAAFARFPRTTKKRIGLQDYASARSRCWPIENAMRFIGRALHSEYEVFVFGTPITADDTPAPPPGVTSLPWIKPSVSFRESAAVMLTLDGMVGLDSAWTHIAGALHVPTIALYASFPSGLRTLYAPTIRAINSRSACDLAPCFYHGGRPETPHAFPPEGPCAKVGHCTALGAIDDRRVLALLEKQMEGKTHELKS